MGLRFLANLLCFNKKVYLSKEFNLKHQIGTIKLNLENLERWGFHEIVLSIKDNLSDNNFMDYCEIIKNSKIYTPLILIGGANSYERVKLAMNCGFDRIGFCSSIASKEKIEFINEISYLIGTQAIILQIIVKDFSNEFIEIYIPKLAKYIVFLHNDLRELISKIRASDLVITDYYADGENKKFRNKILELNIFKKY